MVITARDVDSFALLRPNVERSCMFKGCRRVGRVKLFYGSTKGPQDASYICVNHALDLANEVLSEYKFGQ